MTSQDRPPSTTLNPTASAAAFALWHRPPGHRQRWRQVGTFATETAATAAIAGSGDWLVRPAGAGDPNHDPRPR